MIALTTECLRWPNAGKARFLNDKDSRKDVVVDLANVEYLTAEGLGTLVSLHNKLKAKGSYLALCNVNALVAHVLTVTNVERFIEIRNSRGDLIGGRPFNLSG